VVRVSLDCPQVVPHRALRVLLRCCIFLATILACSLKVNIVSKVTPRILGWRARGRSELLMNIWGCTMASLVSGVKRVTVDLHEEMISCLEERKR